MTLATLADLDVRHKRVLLRLDLNVPLDGAAITDDGRIRAALPTVRTLVQQEAKVIILTHLGRPDGTVNPKYSVAPVAARLGELLGTEVALAPAVTGPQVGELVHALTDGQVLMLENVRFDPRETSKDA